MQARSYQIATPGKLLIAGEYAVTELNQPGIVVAVNRYINVSIAESNAQVLDLPQLGLNQVKWYYVDGKVTFSISDNRLRFMQQAMQTVYAYLTEQQITIQPFQLSVTSELDDSSGVKYGLGSSAAITVATISAILRLHKDETLDKDIIYKLAAISHFQTQGNGSCADIAASTYGGWLHYTSFDGSWLLKQLKTQCNISKIVDGNWASLHIEKLNLPSSLVFCVGWTGKAAATAPMVTRIQQLKENNQQGYQNFLIDSQKAVETIVNGCKTDNAKLMLDGIKQNRNVLRRLSNQAGVEIETTLLNQLANLAEDYGSGKSSGAGGGDCGIAFVEGEENVVKLNQVWEQIGIKTLDLMPSINGTRIIKHE